MAQKNVERRAPGAHAAAAPRRGVLVSFTLRTLAKNRARTVVTIIGIALATGLLAAVFTSMTSLAAALRGQVSTERGIWQIEYPSLTDQQLSTIKSGLDGHLDRLATARDLGACALSEENANALGPALNVQTMPAEDASAGVHAKGDGQYAVKKGSELESGRAPQAPGEIVLPSFYQGQTLTEGDSEYAGVASGAVSDGPVELGSTVRLSLGRRHAQVSEGAVALTGLNAMQFEYSGADRVPLETLDGAAAPREFTVVGFAENSSYFGFAQAYVSDAEPEAGVPAVTCAWASTTGIGNKNDLEDGAISVVGLTRQDVSAAYPSFNSALLNLEGVIDDRTIWTTVIGFIGILSAVIIVAAVSLISNAFAISISERTRQFGLLSSLGASRRQLRRTVFIEAGILGLVGIPLGILIGLAGTYAAFAVTGDGWAVLVGSKTAVPVSVDARALAVVVALSVVTLLISAWAPAKRAGGVSAVDAIRQSGDVKPSRRLLREFGRRSGLMDGFTADGKKPRGIAARFAGIPGFLARRTRVASGGKARVAVASLAISVVLLVTAGILGTYLSQATSYLDYSSKTDYMMYVFKSEKGTEGDDVGVLELAQTAAEKLKGVEDVESTAVLSGNITLVKLADGAMNPDCADEVDEQTAQPDSEGRRKAPVEVVDDATWAALCGHVGLTGADAAPGAGTCIAINRLDIYGGAKYTTLRPLAQAALGTDAELILPTATDGSEWIDAYDVDDESKPVYGVCYTDAEGNLQTKQLGHETVRTERLRIAALAEDVGDDFPLSLKQLAANCPTLIVSASTAEAAGITDVNSMTSICVGTGGKSVDEDKLVEAVGAAGLDTSYTVAVAEQLRNNNAMAYTAQVFLYCFTAICALIAVANVFNTISSGLALRTREFAVLRSVGLGQGGFRRMIALECADHAVRGLAYGLALALLVDYGLYQVMGISFEGFDIALPWGHIALSVALIVAVLAASTVYALRKSHAMNLVDSLRAE